MQELSITERVTRRFVSEPMLCALYETKCKQVFTQTIEGARENLCKPLAAGVS